MPVASLESHLLPPALFSTAEGANANAGRRVLQARSSAANGLASQFQDSQLNGFLALDQRRRRNTGA